MKGKVAIIDSGIGGLTIYNKFLTKFTNITYLADNVFFPYGTKKSLELVNLIDRLIHYFLSHDYKLVILACNTASLIYEKYLKYKYKYLVLPIIQSTIDQLKTHRFINHIGIVGTDHLIESKIYETEIEQIYRIKTTSLPCSHLVTLCEQNDKEGIKKYIEEEFSIFKEKGIDAFLLGCTHFNLVEKEISEYFNHEIPIICSGYSISNQLTYHDLCTICGENKIYLTNYDKKYEDKIRMLYKDLKNIKIEELKV